MKIFNITAVCIPSKHYMVDLSKRVAEIKKLVDAGKYFTINETVLIPQLSWGSNMSKIVVVNAGFRKTSMPSDTKNPLGARSGGVWIIL